MNRTPSLVLVFAILNTHLPSASQTKVTDNSRASQLRRTDYSDWMREYQTQRLAARFGNEPGVVKLLVTAIEGDNPESQETASGPARTLFQRGYSIKYGCAISTDGRVSFFSHTALGSKTSGYPGISEAAQERLDALIAGLPDDFSRLPPPGRRLVLQASSPNGVVARVYDRANAPEQVLEILRLTKCSIKSVVLTLKPTNEWKIGVHGALTATVDGRTLITSAGAGPFRFWDADSHALLREIPESPMPLAPGWTGSVGAAGLRLSPDGSLLAVEGNFMIDLRDAETLKGLRRLEEWKNEHQLYKLFNPQFTMNGRYLLVQSSQPALRIFDTKTMQAVTSIPGLPPGASCLFPAPHARRSVYATPPGEVALWNPEENRDVAQLDTNRSIVRVAYSPDESMVAAVTLPTGDEPVRSEYRVRVWSTNDGSLIQELRPFERSANSVEDLLWSPDGSYVLAVTRPSSFSTDRVIAIWSVRTGRHRGVFTGCPTDVTGLVMLPGGRLAEGCGDGVVREWDISKVISQITEFEASLPTAPNVRE